jgi:hypothetical protein
VVVLRKALAELDAQARRKAVALEREAPFVGAIGGVDAVRDEPDEAEDREQSDQRARDTGWSDSRFACGSPLLLLFWCAP